MFIFIYCIYVYIIASVVVVRKLQFTASAQNAQMTTSSLLWYFKTNVFSRLHVFGECLWKSLVEIHGAPCFLPLLAAPPPLPLCSLLSQPNQHFASLSWECLAFFETYNYHAPWDVLLAVGQLFEPLAVVPVSPSLPPVLLVLHLPHTLFARLVYCPTSLFTTQFNCSPLYFP